MANGLINLQTDLKSLKYSSMPLGSQSPYVTKNIGQAPGSQVGLEIQSRIDDTSRIAKMLIDKPGLKYLLNESLLQQTDIQDKIQKARDKGKTLGGALLQQIGNTVLNTAKIAASTLAQVPVNGTGTHFVKGFRTDTYLQPTNGNTRSGFAQFFGAGGVEGAPLALKGQPIRGEAESNFGTKVSPTEFKVTAQSDLDYDEKVNTLIPNISANVYAEQGTTIIEDNVGIDGWQPYTSTGVKGQFVDRNTNRILSQSKFVDTTVQNKARVKPSGSVVPSVAATIQAPITGDPITIPGIQTTVTPGVKTPQNLITGSIAIKNVKNDLPDNGVNVNQNQNTSTKTYTGKDATYVIGTVLSGSNSIPTGGPVPTDLVVGMSIQDSKNKPQYEKSHTDPTTDRKYTEGNKYYEEQKNRKIGNTQKNVIREKRVGLGDQGKRNKAGVNYWTNPTDDEIDQINYLDVTTVRPEGAGVGRDLAKLYFEIITPNAQPRFLYFRAFIDSFDDSYAADWQAHKYVSRAENFYTYAGFDRDINLSFKVAAATRAEMKPLYKKMVYLASATAPTYGGMMTKYMRGTFARMTVGSYLDQIPGVITSVKYNLIDDMPWEIAMGQPEGVEPESQVLPMGMQCSVTFKPIHDFAPQTGLYPYFTNANEEPRYFTEQDAVLT